MGGDGIVNEARGPPQRVAAGETWGRGPSFVSGIHATELGWHDDLHCRLWTCIVKNAGPEQVEIA